MTRRGRGFGSPLPTPAEAVEAYRSGQTARVGSANPFAGRRVLGVLWWRGYREASEVRRVEFAAREAERRRQAHTEVDDRP
ncbi:ribosome modulation factor [Gordonia aichiensis]|uniref:ribosome modulation factor n=1 Tax=Gordonia aichiensis TaxID=36820 RepID=UPI000348D1AB|nr:hypothetical protein [Gordonia aichiensis]